MTWSVIGGAFAWTIMACLLAAVATDLTDRIIPNRVVVVVFCCSLGLRAVSGTGTLWASILCAIAVFAVLSWLATYNRLGWGDVKLIAAVTLAVSADRVISLLLAITVTGGLLSCLYLAVRFFLRRAPPRPDRAEQDAGSKWTLPRMARRETARILANEPMPYAIAVFGGVAYGLTTR